MTPSSPRRLLTLLLLPLCAVVVVPGAVVRAEDDTPAPTGRVYALLIGVTDYPAMRKQMLARGKSLAQYERHVKLDGCVNDVERWQETLKHWQAAPPVILVGGEQANEAMRPSRKNVLEALDALAAKDYRRGDVVLIHYSGHGVQQPDRDVPDDDVQELDELDGMDEAWLLCDADRHADHRIAFQNTITDDEIGHRLRAIRDRGALVWLVMDCCHSATGMRGVEDVPSKTRNFDPALIGVEVVPAAGVPTRGAFDDADRTSMGGEQDDLSGIVAFYAAQSYQEVPEVRLDQGPGEKPKTYGLLTCALNRALARSGLHLTFGELYEQVVAGYQDFRKHHMVQALAVGDLDRGVFSGRRFEEPRLYVRRTEGGGLELGAGSIHGYGVGTTFDVYRVGESTESESARVGRVEVTAVLAETSACKVVGDDSAWAKGEERAWPAKVRNLVVGDTSLKVGIVDAAGERVALERLPSSVRGVFEDEDNKKRFPTSQPVTSADWLLQVEEREGVLEPVILKPRVLGRGAAQFAVNRDNLESSLFQIFRAENLLRLTGCAGANGLPSNVSIRVQRALPGGKAVDLTRGEELLPGSDLKLELEMGAEVYGAPKAYDIHVFWLDPHFGIDMLFPYEDKRTGMKVGPRLTTEDTEKSIPLADEVLTDGSQGLERLLVVAIPIRTEAPHVDLSFLEADPLKLPDKARALKTRGDLGARGSDNKVKKFLEDLSLGGMEGIGTRGRLEDDEEGEPSRLNLGVVSWTTSWGRLRAPPGEGVVKARVERTRSIPDGGVPSPWDLGPEVRLASAGGVPCLLVGGEGDGPHHVLIDVDGRCSVRTPEALKAVVTEKSFDAEIAICFNGLQTTVWYDTQNRGKGPDLVLRDNDGDNRADERWVVTDEGDVVHVTGLDETLLMTTHLEFLKKKSERKQALVRLAALSGR